MLWLVRFELLARFFCGFLYLTRIYSECLRSYYVLQLTTLQTPKVEDTSNGEEIDTKDVQNAITLAEAAELPYKCAKQPCLHKKAIQGIVMFHFITLLF